MAKKTLTPEQAEIKAMKKEKSSQNWTKFWAIVLAAALTFGVVFLGKSQADKAIEEAGANNNAVVDNNNTVDNNDDDGGSMFDDETPSGDTNAPSGDTNAPSGDTNAPSGDTNTPSGDTNTPSGDNKPAAPQVSKADVAKALNDATAKASKASYDWTRSAKFTKNIDVGSLTGALDGIIKGVDENASLNSVVGGFLGIKETPFSATVVNGQLPESGMNGEPKYLLKAMTLTEGDIQDFRVNGNTYQVQIKNCTNPDENSALAHMTNDYITFAQVNESIAGAVGDAVKVEESGSQANYKSILVTAVIENGTLTSLKYSYTFDAKLKIKIAIASATGTGEAKMEAQYSNFKY